MTTEQIAPTEEPQPNPAATPAPESAAPEPAPEPVVELTPEQLEAERLKTVEDYFGNKKRQKPEAKKEEATALVVEKKEEKPEEEPKPAAKKKKKDEPKLVDPVPQFDEEALAERVAEKVRAKAQATPPEPAKPNEDAGLSDEDKEELEALAVLSKNPKYQGRDLTREAREFWRREQEYAAKWEQEHPTEEWKGEEDPDHAAFYKRFRPKIYDNDLKQAEDEVKESKFMAKAEERMRAKFEPELEAMRMKELEREVEPLTRVSANQAVIEMVAEAVPEFKTLLDDGSGNLVITEKNLDQMRETNPEALEILNEEAHALKIRVSELEKLSRMNGAYRPDIAKKVRLPDQTMPDGSIVKGDWISPHAEIADTAWELEDRISALDKKDRIHEGKHWVRRQDMVAQQQAIMESREDQATKKARMDSLTRSYWTIDASHIRDALRSKSAKNVRRIIETAKKIVGRETTKKTKEAEIQKTKEVEQRPTPSARAPSPSTNSAADTVAANLPGVSGNGVSEQQVIEKWFK